MSNESWTSPPPPPSGGSIPPPPPMPSAPPPSPGGYQVGGAQWQSTAGLRTATIILFWVTTVTCALLSAALFARQGVAQDFLDGEATFTDLDDADTAAGGAVALVVLAAIASAILVSIWALRAARNAQSRGGRDLSPGLACGSWYIPFGNYVVPFIQVRRMTRTHGRSRTPAGVWQAGFIIGSLSIGAVNALYDEDDLNRSPQEFTDALGMQGVAALIATVAYGVAAFAAMKAMRNADGA